MHSLITLLTRTHSHTTLTHTHTHLQLDMEENDVIDVMQMQTGGL